MLKENFKIQLNCVSYPKITNTKALFWTSKKHLLFTSLENVNLSMFSTEYHAMKGQYEKILIVNFSSLLVSFKEFLKKNLTYLFIYLICM